MEFLVTSSQQSSNSQSWREPGARATVDILVDVSFLIMWALFLIMTERMRSVDGTSFFSGWLGSQVETGGAETPGVQLLLLHLRCLGQLHNLQHVSCLYVIYLRTMFCPSGEDSLLICLLEVDYNFHLIFDSFYRYVSRFFYA